MRSWRLCVVKVAGLHFFFWQDQRQSQWLMLLEIDGHPILEEDGLALLARVENSPHHKALASSFLSLGTTEISSSRNTLVVLQREFAVFSLGDKPGECHRIGSDSATTCVVVAIFPDSGDLVGKPVAVGHFDGAGTAEALSEMVKGVLAREGTLLARLRVCIAGGFDDARGLSVPVVTEILEWLRSAREVEFVLQLCCVGKLNTVMLPRPVIFGGGRVLIPSPAARGLCVNWKGEVFSAHLPHDLHRAQRSSILLTSEDRMSCISTPDSSALVFRASASVDNEILLAHEMLACMPDAMLLTHSSTSPEVESPRYVVEFGENFKFLKELGKRGKEEKSKRCVLGPNGEWNDEVG